MSDAALPWIGSTVERAHCLRHAHAVLLHGAAGDGLFEAAERIVQAWLCESTLPGHARPCGHCSACRQAAAATHPDLKRLLPEELRLQLGAGESDAQEGGDGDSRARRRPSRQIRIDEVRSAIDWLATSSSRGAGKVVLIHPAEALNPQSANALLKTLEEPPRGVRLLLSSSRPDALLPTVRSRCQVIRLSAPPAALALEWLRNQGLAHPEVLLAACSGRPIDALALAAAGIDAPRWNALPQAVLAGHAAALAGWPAARVLDALQKLALDGLALSMGAQPRYFASAGLRPPRSTGSLLNWSRELGTLARQIEHPWNEGLLIESLLQRARQAWAEPASASDTLAR